MREYLQAVLNKTGRPKHHSTQVSAGPSRGKYNYIGFFALVTVTLQMLLFTS